MSPQVESGALEEINLKTYARFKLHQISEFMVLFTRAAMLNNGWWELLNEYCSHVGKCAELFNKITKSPNEKH